MILHHCINHCALTVRSYTSTSCCNCAHSFEEGTRHEDRARIIQTHVPKSPGEGSEGAREQYSRDLGLSIEGGSTVTQINLSH